MSSHYKVLQAATQEELSNKVNVLMDYGWSPEGGMTVDETKAEKFTQTMIRKPQTIKTEGSMGDGKQLLHG